jgi:PilZ domain-containing protein
LSEPQGRERRRFERYEAPVSYRSARPEVFSRILDISVGGIRVVTANDWPPGHRTQMALMVPGGAVLNMTAEVVWSRPLASGEWEVGMRFVDVDDFDRHRLASLLSGQPAAD